MLLTKLCIDNWCCARQTDRQGTKDINSALRKPDICPECNQRTQWIIPQVGPALGHKAHRLCSQVHLCSVPRRSQDTRAAEHSRQHSLWDIPCTEPVASGRSTNQKDNHDNHLVPYPVGVCLLRIQCIVSHLIRHLACSALRCSCRILSAFQ